MLNLKEKSTKCIAFYYNYFFISVKNVDNFGMKLLKCLNSAKEKIHFLDKISHRCIDTRSVFKHQ